MCYDVCIILYKTSPNIFSIIIYVFNNCLLQINRKIPYALLVNQQRKTAQRMEEIDGYCYGGDVIGHGAFAVVYKGRHKEVCIW